MIRIMGQRMIICISDDQEQVLNDKWGSFAENSFSDQDNSEIDRHRWRYRLKIKRAIGDQ